MARFNLGRFNLRRFNTPGGGQVLSAAASFDPLISFTPLSVRDMAALAETIVISPGLLAKPTAHFFDGLLFCTPAVSARPGGATVAARNSIISAALRDVEVEAI